MRPQTIVERLDFVAKRIPGLKFTPPTQLKPGDDQFYGCFMSCDMYYIEIKVDQSHQSVKDVIISHGNSADGISCPVLRKVLADQDFETFAKHLTGLHSIYQINTNDKKVKQKAYPALTSLESDLSILYDHQRRRVSNCNDLVHKSPIGFMESRKGGLPVKLTYFITPYDLVDTSQRKLINLNVNNIMDRSLGLSATVEIEGSNPHKIQVKPLILQTNSSLPHYAPFNSQNSEKLPAHFVLKLSQPLPMLVTSLNQIINEINEPTTIKDYISQLTMNSKESIITLIARQELDLNKGPFCRTVDTSRVADIKSCDLKKHVYSVKLPDQAHTYHVLDNYLEKPEGVYVTKLPFTHPTSIPSILKILRQQSTFNFVIGSCIRRNRQANSSNGGIPEMNNNDSFKDTQVHSDIFDVIPVSLNNICISFEHPSKESLATLEIDFKDWNCQLYALDKDSVCSNEFATKVLQKCWSIPITLRSVLKECDEKRLALLEDSNKRRERELQELLTTNSAGSTQQGLPLKSTPKCQDTLLPNKFNPSSTNQHAINHRDLNSIAEFLSNKVITSNTASSGSTSVRLNNDQTSSNDLTTGNSNNRTNLLKKFSCKPKVKQNATTKSNQPGNKMLSLMLKRQNPTLDDQSAAKLPSAKKLKTKQQTTTILSESGGYSDLNNQTTGPMTTKLITSEALNASRLANKQGKQAPMNSLGNQQPHQNISLSLIRSPSKQHQPNAVATPVANQQQPNTITSAPVLLSNTSPQKQWSDSSSSRFNDMINNIKTNGAAFPANSLDGSGSAVKPRKSSIGTVIDDLVGNVTPEQLQQQQLLLSGQATDNENKNTPGNNSGTNKSKSSRMPGGDQFAIKQGSSGGGLKLTVTKTKPSTPHGASSTTTNNSSTMSPSTVNATASSNSNNISSSAISITAAQNNQTKSEISTNKSSNDSSTQSSTPSIRYTIPKISKSNQASQSSNNANENSNSNDSQGDDSNPSSSGNNVSLAPSSTTANASAAQKQRTTSNPFKQTGITNRGSSVSSSTHPPNRTTSNPLTNSNRPSSTSNESIASNRISSSSNNAGSSGAAVAVNSATLSNNTTANIQQLARQQQQHLSMNRTLNLTPSQQQMMPTSILPALQQLPNIQHMINPAILNQTQAQQQAQQLIRQQVPNMFSLHLANQQNAFPNQNDLNLIVASQAALLNQQKQMQIQQQQQQLLQQTQQQRQMQPELILSTQQLKHGPVTLPQPSVSSSTEFGNGSNRDKILGQNVAQPSNMTSSTPSSPTECGQVETVPPPALIPIDSLDEVNPTSPDEDDVRDDESDRLSIVDMNEGGPDCNSTAGTPKASQMDSSYVMDVQEPVATAAVATGSITSSLVTPSSPPAASSSSSSLTISHMIKSEPATTAAPSTTTTIVTAANASASVATISDQ